MSFETIWDPTVIEHQVSSGPCYAVLNGELLILGNDRIEQRWHLSHGQLLPAGMRERTSVNDWAILPQPAPPRLPHPLPDWMGEIHFSTTSGPFFAPDPTALQIDLRFPFADDPILADSQPRVLLIYHFLILPGVLEVRITLDLQQADDIARLS